MTTACLKRFEVGKWHFSVWKLENPRFGWKRDKWDAGSFAIGFRVVTYLRTHH